ncbi:hypothetical protein [Prosthecobacter sp.]|uniref:hypothetical protein n=1 Tax=Prosthecobacter sp. TaxID=1965333 RepID=UPI00378377FA
MKQLTIQIDGSQCTAWFTSESGTKLAEDSFTMQHGTHSWSLLQGEVHDRLQLHKFAPPGMPTESSRTCSDPFRIWQVVCCGIPGAPGWGWGFLLPLEHVETCCGFADEESAAKAAKTLQLIRSRISGDLPGGVFEVFALDDGFAFFDQRGEHHATFPTAAEARGCAAKMEANHPLNEQPR